VTGEARRRYCDQPLTSPQGKFDFKLLSVQSFLICTENEKRRKSGAFIERGPPIRKACKRGRGFKVGTQPSGGPRLGFCLRLGLVLGFRVLATQRKKVKRALAPAPLDEKEEGRPVAKGGGFASSLHYRFPPPPLPRLRSACARSKKNFPWV